MSLRVVHISDPHFGTIKESAMKALLLAMKILQPQVMVISGDITQRARRIQFEQARIFTHTFEGLPVLVLPGNHDIPLYNIFGRFLHPYFGFKRILKGDLNQEIHLNHVQILALNSTRRSRIVQGQIDLKVLKRRLKDGKKSKVRIVVFHHPLDCPRTVDEKNLLKNREEVIRVLEEECVDLSLHGHIHDPYICTSDHRYPQLKRNMVIGVAGTCLSSRTRRDANNSFNLIDINTEQSEARMTISRYDLVEEAVFEATESHRFIRCDEKGWKKN